MRKRCCSLPGSLGHVAPQEGACPGRAGADVAVGSSSFSMSTNLPSKPRDLQRSTLTRTTGYLCSRGVSFLPAPELPGTALAPGFWLRNLPLSLPSSSLHPLPAMLVFAALGRSSALFNPQTFLPENFKSRKKKCFE